MGQMFDKICDQMNIWRRHNPRAFWDQVDRSDPQTTGFGTVKRTTERSSWYSSDDLRNKIKPPSSRQYIPGDLLTIRPLNWVQIMDKDDVDDKWADTAAPSGGCSRPGDGNDNVDGESEGDMQRGETGTWKMNGTNDWNGKGKATLSGEVKGKGQGKGNGKWKGTIKHTPGGDDISRAVALQLRKEMPEVDMDTGG